MCPSRASSQLDMISSPSTHQIRMGSSKANLRLPVCAPSCPQAATYEQQYDHSPSSYGQQQGQPQTADVPQQNQTIKTQRQGMSAARYEQQYEHSPNAACISKATSDCRLPSATTALDIIAARQSPSAYGHQQGQPQTSHGAPSRNTMQPRY
eukprot:gene17874-24265_t